MTPQISDRRAAEDFARVVDGSLQDVADQEEEAGRAAEPVQHPRPPPGIAPVQGSGRPPLAR